VQRKRVDSGTAVVAGKCCRMDGIERGLAAVPLGTLGGIESGALMKINCDQFSPQSLPASKSAAKVRRFCFIAYCYTEKCSLTNWVVDPRYSRKP